MSDFNWLDDDSIVWPPAQGMAIYRTTKGDVVIRQNGTADEGDDTVIVFDGDRLEAVITALQNLRA